MAMQLVSLNVAVSDVAAVVDTILSAEKDKILRKTIPFSRYKPTDVTSSFFRACDALQALATAKVSDKTTL